MGVELVPLAPGHFARLEEIRREPAVTQWWGTDVEGFPESDDPDSVRYAVMADGELAGLIQFWEEPEPAFRHAGVDMLLGDGFRGRGIGTAAVRAILEILIARGHHRVTIDPSVGNLAAIRCYEKAGFRRVGVLRQYWQDPDGVWQDNLLMDWVRAER